MHTSSLHHGRYAVAAHGAVAVVLEDYSKNILNITASL